MDRAAWQRIVENSTPAVWEVEVRDEDDAVRRVEVPFIETIETAGTIETRKEYWRWFSVLYSLQEIRTDPTD